MITISINYLLSLTAVVFLVNRKNILTILMSIELLLLRNKFKFRNIKMKHKSKDLKLRAILYYYKSNSNFKNLWLFAENVNALG